MKYQMRILQGVKLAAVLAVALAMGARAKNNVTAGAMASAATPGRAVHAHLLLAKEPPRRYRAERQLLKARPLIETTSIAGALGRRFSFEPVPKGCLFQSQFRRTQCLHCFRFRC